MPTGVPIDKWVDECNAAVKAVRDLCNKNPTYLQIFWSILEVDKAYQDNQFGWEFDKIEGWSGAHVKTLMDAGIIRHGYKSNQYTYYRLNFDHDMFEKLLAEIAQSWHLKDDNCTLNRGDVVLEPEMIKEFEELIASGQDMLMYWAQRLNPRIIGMEMERQACLITLASPDDKDGLVRRCHTLIYGPPGTAKSVIITYIKHNLDAVGISPSSSEAGLKMDARGQGTPGALMMAHKRTLVAEEIDKFDKRSIESMYEAMTTGEFDLNKGDIRQTCAAEIREIAVGNDISKLPAPFIDRFDMIIYCEIPNKDAEKEITNQLYMQWIRGQEDYKGVKLRAYLEFIKQFEPAITLEIMQKCLDLKNAYIDLAEKKPDVREKEAFLRVAFTISKLNHRDLTVMDYLRAIRLVDSKFSREKYHALEIIAGQLSK